MTCYMGCSLHVTSFSHERLVTISFMMRNPSTAKTGFLMYRHYCRQNGSSMLTNLFIIIAIALIVLVQKNTRIKMVLCLKCAGK